MARRLIHEEGLLCGGSSGSAVAGAIKACKDLKPGQRCVVLLADGTRNYMSKFLSDDWMIDNGFLDPSSVEDPNAPKEPWMQLTVKDICTFSDLKVKSNTKVEEVIKILSNPSLQRVDMIPVENENGEISGIASGAYLQNLIQSRRITINDAISKGTLKQYRLVSENTKLSELSRIFVNEPYSLVSSKDGKIIGFTTRIDLLQAISSSSKSSKL